LCCYGHYATDLSFASALAAVLSKRVHLTHLELTRYEETLISVAPMPQVLVDALEHCPGWESLEIECYSVDDAQMMPMEVLAVPAGAGLTVAFVVALAQHCRSLSWLHLTNHASITEGALLHLIQRCRS
jgi:hypothetical protein